MRLFLAKYWHLIQSSIDKKYNGKWKHIIFSTKIWTVYKPNSDKKADLHTTIRNSNNFTPE
jgi:hypothetical protein